MDYGERRSIRVKQRDKTCMKDREDSKRFSHLSPSVLVSSPPQLTFQPHIPLTPPKLPPHTKTPRNQRYIGNIMHRQLDQKARLFIVDEGLEFTGVWDVLMVL